MSCYVLTLRVIFFYFAIIISYVLFKINRCVLMEMLENKQSVYSFVFRETAYSHHIIGIIHITNKMLILYHMFY